MGRVATVVRREAAMKWEDGDASGNVEDRRGMGGAVAAGGGIIGLIVMAVAFYMTGDLRQAKFIADRVGPVVNKAVPPRNPGQGKAGVNDRMLDFSKKIMGYTDRAWADVFAAHGNRYEKPTLVLFTDRVDSEGCGVAPSSVGPFYCPASRKVFVDPSFFEELESRLKGSKADFSKAYVIAHEVGHHVQNLLGYNKLVEQYRRREGRTPASALSFRPTTSPGSAGTGSRGRGRSSSRAMWNRRSPRPRRSATTACRKTPAAG